MTLETFFEKFDQLADVPNAAAKMRELVLELAVRGKLTAQDPTDEPAVVLLRNIRTEKSRQKAMVESLDTVTAAEVDGEHFPVPSNWAWVSTMTPAVMVSDQGKKVQTKDILASGRYPVVDQGKVFIRGYCDDSDKVIHVSEPIVLFGDHTRETKLIDFDFVVGADGAKLLQPICVDPKFYFLALRWLPLENRGYARHFKLLRAARIPLPPLAEQKRIVAKVDELMALCDRLEAQQEERETRYAALARASLARFADAPTSANLNFLFHDSYSIDPADLRKAILTLTVQGKLVPQDPNDEPAAETLVKVLRNRERQERSLRIKEPSPVVAGAEHMPDLPCGWCYASPDQLTAFHKNALTIGPFGSSLLKSDYTDEGVPLVFVRDIRSESFGGPETRFVTTDKAEELASHTVRPGDLLITKMGDPPGDTAIYPEGKPRAIITADCIKITPHADVVSAEYLRFAIRASQIAEQFAGITLGVAQQKVSLGRFRCIAVPLPPLAEQRRIVAKVEQVMALVDQLETQLTHSRATAVKLMEAVVAELTT